MSTYLDIVKRKCAAAILRGVKIYICNYVWPLILEWPAWASLVLTLFELYVFSIKYGIISFLGLCPYKRVLSVLCWDHVLSSDSMFSVRTISIALYGTTNTTVGPLLGVYS
jgi:hypothetical protein